MQLEIPCLMPCSSGHVEEQSDGENQTQTVAFTQHAQDNDVVILEEKPESFKENEEQPDESMRVDVHHTSAADYIKPFQPNMEFKSAMLVNVPDAVKKSLIGEREPTIKFFGDLSGNSELEKAKIWSNQAAAGASDLSEQVPDPICENFKMLMKAVHNHVVVAGMNVELERGIEAAEAGIHAAELAWEKNESMISENRNRVNDMMESFQAFCQDVEQSYFPHIRQAEELFRSYGAGDVEEFQLRLVQKFQQEVDAREQLTKELNERISFAKEKAEHTQSNLKAEVQRLGDLVSAKDSRMEEIKTQIQAEKTAASITKIELEGTRKMLETRIYTQEQYDENYENGFRTGRRFAIHAAPNINWDLAEQWSMDLNHPNMRRPHPNELALNSRLSKNEVLDKDDGGVEKR